MLASLRAKCAATIKEREQEDENEEEKRAEENPLEKNLKEIDLNNVKKVLQTVAEKKPHPWANTYVSRERRGKLYEINEDKNKAKFQARNRKFFIKMNQSVKAYVEEKTSFKSDEDKDGKQQKTTTRKTLNIIDGGKTTEDFLKHLLNDNDKDGKQQKKILKKLDKIINSQTDIKNEIINTQTDIKNDIQKIFEKQDKMENDLNRIKENQTDIKKNQKRRQQEFMLQLQPYLTLIDDLRNLFFENTRDTIKGQETNSLSQSLKKIRNSWILTLLDSIKKMFVNVFQVGANIGGFLFVSPFLGGGRNYLEKAFINAVLLFGSIVYISIHLNIIVCFCHLIAYFTGSSILVDYIQIAVDELISFLYGLAIDACLVPIRSWFYIGRGFKTGYDDKKIDFFQTLFIENKRNTRLWYIAKQIIDFSSNHVTYFFDTLEKCSWEFKALVYVGKKTIKGIQFVFNLLCEMVELGVQSAFVMTNYAQKAIYDTKVAALKQIAYVATKLKNSKPFFQETLKYLKNAMSKAYNYKRNIGPPQALYDATAVCSLLGIPIVALKQHRNKELVSYVLNNKMNKLQTVAVAFDLSKDLDIKYVLPQTTKLIKF